MKTIIHKGKLGAPIFILFHGTGGDATSLLSLGQELDKTATLISVQGEVLEQGMRRFFKRKAAGVYDEEDLNLRTQEMHTYLEQLAKEHEFSLTDSTLVGYSNGANLAISLLLHAPTSYKQAILHHPMYPLKELPNVSLKEAQIFATFGQHDPLVPLVESQHVMEILQTRGAQVTPFWTQAHQLVQAAQKWLKMILK